MTLKEWRAKIKEEVPYVGIKPFSHNIIRLALHAIAKDFGKAAANKAVRDFKLEDKGFNEESD